MKFSIIVPIYNVEKYLSKCIESILSQSIKDYEVILVNDGSTDKCAEICDFYGAADPRIRVIHKENGGVVSARKAACNIAIGEDGDDWIHKDYLMKIEKIIDECSPDVIKIRGYYAYEDIEIEMPIELQEGYYERNEVKEKILPFVIEDKTCKRVAPSICLHIVRRELYRKYQNTVPNQIRIGEDLACTALVLINTSSLFVCNECLYYYRQNPISMTKKKQKIDMYEPKRIAEHLEKNIEDGEYDIQISRIAVHLLFNACVSQFDKIQSFWFHRKRILSVIKDEYYKKAISRCNYKFYSKGFVALFSLRYKCIWAIYMWSVVHNKKRR